MPRSKRETTEVTTCFAENLTRLVNKKNTGLVQVAEEIGISRSQISDYMNNKKTPTIDTLYKICEYFDVSADFMLTGVLTENRKMAKYTGLSNAAIEWLHQVHTSKSIFHRQWLPILNRILVTKGFWENIMVYLDTAYRIKKGVNETIDDEQINTAVKIVKLHNAAGYTHNFLFDGKKAADIHIQMAADDTRTLYKTIIDELVGGENNGVY